MHSSKNDFGRFAGGAPEDERHRETEEGGGESWPGSALAEGHRQRKRRGSPVVERADDGGWDEKQSDARADVAKRNQR